MYVLLSFGLTFSVQLASIDCIDIQTALQVNAGLHWSYLLKKTNQNRQAYMTV